MAYLLKFLVAVLLVGAIPGEATELPFVKMALTRFNLKSNRPLAFKVERVLIYHPHRDGNVVYRGFSLHLIETICPNKKGVNPEICKHKFPPKRLTCYVRVKTETNKASDFVIYTCGRSH